MLSSGTWAVVALEGHGRVVVSLKDQGVSSVIRWHCAELWLQERYKEHKMWNESVETQEISVMLRFIRYVYVYGYVCICIYMYITDKRDIWQF